MIRPCATRDRLIKVVEQYGMKLVFVAKQLDWNYPNLCKFKNGQVNISLKREKKLSKFLDKFDKQSQVG